MKINIENAALSVDIDPEDLSDEALRECMAVAVARGLEPSSPGHSASDLHRALERAYAALLRGNPPVALAQIAPFISAEGSASMIKSAIGASYAMAGDRSPRPAQVNGAQPRYPA